MLRAAIKRGIALSAIAATLIGAPRSASAQLAIFQTEYQARFHCPNDVVVWLDFPKRRYYQKGQRLYGEGRTGVYACREEVRQNHHRKSWLGLR